MTEPEDDEHPGDPARPTVKPSTRLSLVPLLFVLTIAAAITFVLARGERTMESPSSPPASAASVDEPPETREKALCLAQCNTPCTAIKDRRRRYECLAGCDATCKSAGGAPPAPGTTARP